MTPTIGWIMAIVAVAAVIALVVVMRRSSPGPGFQPTHQESVDVIVDECGETSFSLRVDPWHVYVSRDRPLRWVFRGPPGSTMEIQPKDSNTWPFPGPPTPPKANPGESVQAGEVTGKPGTQHKYSIVLRCDGRSFDIDPDVYIFD